MPALDDLADHRRRDLVGDLDVPHLALALGNEIGEQPGMAETSISLTLHFILRRGCSRQIVPGGLIAALKDPHSAGAKRVMDDMMTMCPDRHC